MNPTPKLTNATTGQKLEVPADGSVVQTAASSSLDAKCLELPGWAPGPETAPPARASLLSSLRELSEAARTERKTMPELNPITKRSDWAMCEDGTLQDLIFDSLTLHDVIGVLGPMAEALARRVNNDDKAGVATPLLDTQVLQAYRCLLADNIPAADNLRNWNNR